MIKVKDGYAKLIGTTYSGSVSRVLLSNGGDHILGNSSGNIPLNNGTINTNLNADMLDGLHIHAGRNHEVNKIVRTDASGHILAGWINTTSGDIGTGAINKIYCSNDNYIRYKTPANFFPTLANSGNDISITVAGLNRTLTVGYATNANKVDGYHANKIYNAPSFTVNNSNTSNTYILLATITISGTSLGCAEFTTLFQNRECLDSSSFILSGAIRRSSTTSVTATLSYITLHTGTPRNIYLRSNDGVTFMVYILSATGTWTTFYRAIPIVDSGNITYSNIGTASPISGSVLNITATKGGNVNYANSAGNADTLDGNHASAFATSGHNHDNRYLHWNGSAANITAMNWGTLTSTNGYTILSHASSSDGGDMGFVNKGGQIFMLLDGYYYLNEGKYRVLDTSDIAGLKNNLTIHQYLSTTDTTWWPLIWGGNSHNNTSDSTGAVYKSHDKLSWQTSSLTLYATKLKTTNLNTLTAFFHPDNDSTLKIYSGKITDAKSDGNICLQTSIDGTDGQSHEYPTQHDWRCNLVLQPRGGQVYIGTNPDGGNTAYKLYVNGDIYSSTYIRAASGFVKEGSSNSYVLLGGGSHKALSDFSMAHSHPYLPLSGGTMTGLIKGNNKGGSWILGRANAALYLPRTTTDDWHPVIGFKTKTGSWEFGNVGNDDFATFSWESDSNYSSGTNTNTRVNLRAISGTIALTSDIPTKSSWNYDDRYSKLGHTHDDRYYTESEINSKLGAYLPLSGGTLTGTLTTSTTGTGSYNQGIRINRTSTNQWATLLIGKSGTATSGTGTSTAGDGAWLIATPASSNSLVFNLNSASETVGLCLKGHGASDMKWNNNTVLHAGNSNVSGGGSTWGSSITVNINGISKTLTIPGNPNTDYRVTQSETTTANYRPLVLGYTNVSTAGSGMTGSITNQVYLSNKFYVQPSTGNLYATNFVGTLSGNASTATKLQTSRNLWGNSFNGTANISGTIIFNNVTSGLCEGILWTCGDNDFARIKAGATGSNAGYLEIATADGGNEPIYVRQYTGTFSKLIRTLTLLDTKGNTTFPGTASASGFIKSGSNDNYVLLGGGGHKAVSDFSTSGHTHDGRYMRVYLESDVAPTSTNGYWSAMTTQSGISGDWWHIIHTAWNNAANWRSELALPTQGRNGIRYRSDSDDGSGWTFGSWVKLLDENNWSNYCAAASHSHNYLPLSGGTMTGNITYKAKGTSYIGNGANDAAYGVGGALNNLVISSWYGVSFTTSCGGQTYTGTNAVSINCRNGYVYANTFVGTLSGNATSATKLATARSIFGKSFDGTANVSGQGLFYGTYTSSANARYLKSGLLIRENDLVKDNLSDIGYAPSIGFHWGSKTAATMLLHSDGNFYFRKIDGVTRASLDANIIGNASTATDSDKVDGYHASSFALQSAHNDLIASGNEFTFVPSGFNNSVYFNYRTKGGTNGNITSYIFGNGKGGALGIALHTGNYTSYCATSSHNHDSVYSKLGHTHDDRYYTESEINTKLGTYLPLSGGTMTGVIKSTFASSSWINGVTNAVVKGEYTGYGAILSMPVKDGRVSISSYPSNNNYIYFGYATSKQISAGTNDFNKQMYWDAANNRLVADTFLGALYGNATTATTAIKLSTSSAGSTSLPVYFSNGIPVACTKSSIFSNLSNNGDQLSVTVAGLNRLLTVAYASRADSATNANYATNADTLDGYHAHEFSLNNHTHTLKLESSTGASSINLVHGGKYKLTAGGGSVVFTLPTDITSIEFSGGLISSSGNTLTQANHSITIDGQTRTAGSSNCNIINSLSVNTLSSTATTNLSAEIAVNGVTSTLKTITQLHSRFWDVTSNNTTSNISPGNYSATITEVQGNASGITGNLPTTSYYHVYTAVGKNTKYATLLALGMTTDGIWYRKYSNSSWGSWLTVLHSGNIGNYYWANINISSTQNTNTTPRFGKVMINTTSTSYQLNVNGDSYTTGWSRAKNGFYCEDYGVYFTHNNSSTTIGEIDIASNNEFCWGSNSDKLYFNYRGVSRGTTVTKYVWNAGSPSSYASHTTGHITLGNSDYLIKRVGCSVSWVNGRNSAIVRQTSASGYSAIISSKTANGSWEMGNCTDYGDRLYFTYITDSNYTIGNNTFSAQVYFDTSGTFYAKNLNASNWILARIIEITNDAIVSGSISVDNGISVEKNISVGNNINAAGSIYATHFYENSDIRYKKILRNLSINSNTIANLPLFDFEWIENNAIGTGTSALAVLLILPNLVSGTDKLTLDYGVLGTIAGITACKELVKVNTEIFTLKSELLQLKEKVRLLEDRLRKYENI